MPVKRFILVSAAAVAVTGGAAGAIAAVSGDDGKKAEQSILSDAAKRLNVSPDALRSALSDAENAQIDQAVKDGKLTQQQADAIKARRKQDGRVLGVPGGPGHGPDFRGRGPFGPLGADADAAAKALGLSAAELRKQLAGGKSIADVAKAQNKNLADVKAALKAAAAQRLGDAVKAGKLTGAQRDEMLKELDGELDDVVNATPGSFRGADGPAGPEGSEGPGDHGGRGLLGAGLDAAAKALGLETAELRKQLAGGTSVADIAKAQNKDLADVKAAIKDAVTKQLDADVAAKRLTGEQRTQALSELDERLGDLLNATPGKLSGAPGDPRSGGDWQ